MVAVGKKKQTNAALLEGLKGKSLPFRKFSGMLCLLGHW